MLDKYTNKVSNQIEAMDKQINELTTQIDKAYSHMNKNPYYLHAICVHDGSA